MCKVKGAKGESSEVPIIEQVLIKGNSQEVKTNVLFMPKLECNLLGRDLPVKLKIGVVPEHKGVVAKLIVMPGIGEGEISEEVQAKGGEVGLLSLPPITVQMKSEDTVIRVKQYPISKEGRSGLVPVIKKLIEDYITF